MRFDYKCLSITLVILLVPTTVLTFLVWRLLSYGPVAEIDANVAQTEITQKIKRITDLGDRFGITADVLAFTFRFHASTTTKIALPVRYLGKEYIAPVMLTLSEIKDCSSFIPSGTQDTHLLLTECLSKHNNTDADNTDQSVLKLIGNKNLIIKFYPDLLSTIVIFAIIYLVYSTFLVIFFKIWKSVREAIISNKV